MKKGLLIINLGTPDRADQRAVYRYLREFLSDERVIQLPTWLRSILLYGTILPFRTKKTTHAYQRIWTKVGSPLLVHSRNVQARLQQQLGEQVVVSLGMRYGNPSIAHALSQLADCQEITILPLFPQYASATTGSAIEKTLGLLAKQSNIPSIRVIHEFYNHPAFIKAIATSIQPYVNDHDHLLFSYHGLPERHLASAGCITPCQTPCHATPSTKPYCYRSQCYQTTNHIAETLKLDPTHYSTSFQSRLGRIPWIRPYTDETLLLLRKQGIKRLAIACPSFMADCLETLEEIAIQANALWMAQGGESLTLIPCLNDHQPWVDALIEIANP